MHFHFTVAAIEDSNPPALIAVNENNSSLGARAAITRLEQSQLARLIEVAPYTLNHTKEVRR
jgi:hypothetical protein